MFPIFTIISFTSFHFSHSDLGVRNCVDVIFKSTYLNNSISHIQMSECILLKYTSSNFVLGFSLNKSVKIISSEDCVCRDPFEDLNHIHIRCSELVFNAVCQCRYALNKLATIPHFDIIRKHRSTLNEISLHTTSRKS